MPRRILVVEDTKSIADLFEEVLNEEGYEVVLALDPSAALASIKRLYPDLIILDYMFNGVPEGWQMIHTLKQHPTTATIPIIVCTAATRALQEAEAYLEANEIQIIAKPFDLTELLNAVDHALYLTQEGQV